MGGCDPHADERVEPQARNAARDGRATVTIDDSKGGLDVCCAMFVGHAELIEEPESLRLNARISAKYVPQAGLRLPSVTDALAGLDVTLRLRPERIVSWDATASAGARDLLETGEFLPLSPVHRR